MQHLPVKTPCFLQFGISCELGNRKIGREAQRLHLPVKTQCFVHLGISCELGNRKKWDGRQTVGIYLWKANALLSLEEDQQHAHWCFHNRVWRPKDVKTSESETVPTGTVDGRNIQTPSIRYNPLAPKFNVIVAWSALAPMDEKNQTPNITFANNARWNIEIWGCGVQHSACCRVWIFCPSTVSFSDVFTSFGLQLCCGNINVRAADLLPNCAKHWLFTSKCLLSVSRPFFFYSLIRNLFLSAQNLCFHR